MSNCGEYYGPVYQTKAGRWYVTVTLGSHPETGRPVRKYLYADARSEAIAKGLAFRLEDPNQQRCV